MTSASVSSNGGPNAVLEYSDQGGGSIVMRRMMRVSEISGLSKFDTRSASQFKTGSAAVS